MVLDPVNTIGLVSNVLQLIDFSCKILSEGRQIYASANGMSAKHAELADAAETLIKVLDHIIKSPHSNKDALDDQEEELKRLCENCRKVALDLTATLNRLKLRASKFRGWSSLRQAVRVLLSHDEIDRLLSRIQEARQLLDTQMLACIRTGIRNFHSQQTALHDQFSRMDGRIQRSEEDFAKKRARERADNSKWQADVIAAIYNSNWQVPWDESKSPGEDQLASQKAEHFQQVLLNQLWFSSITDRHERIAKAYRKTFKWIFRDPQKDGKPWTSFVDWLQNGEGIYWISGKAGSGKSTLVKYLYDNPQSYEHLERWSGPLPLMVAGFFFWNSGEEMQMSQDGLLQCLLYQLLKQAPNLISRSFPQRWTSYHVVGEHSHPWGRTELLKALENLIAIQSLSSKIFLCIDGLDEFNGNHTELIESFKRIASSSNVKLCVSSRPWLAFEDAFGRGPKLVLQDLTYPDIQRFIASKLCQNTRFVEFQQRQPELTFQFRTEIAEKASGVFLWVDLVITSLLQGLCNSDRISDLQRRLRALPCDLEHLYQGLFSSIEPFYFRHASQLFRIYRAAQGSLTLLDLSFADTEDPHDVVRAETKPLSSNDRRFRCEEMMRRLNSRCRGFLEVSLKPDTERRGTNARLSGSTYVSNDSDRSERVGAEDVGNSSQGSSTTLNVNKLLPPIPSLAAGPQEVDTDVLASSTVEYLHRSARDFLESPAIWDQILTATQEEFDPHLSLCGMYIMQLKTMEQRTHVAAGQRSTLSSELWNLTIPCLAHLGEMDTAFDELQNPLIDQLENAMQYHGNIADFKTYLPAIATRFGIHAYIRANLKRGTFPFEDHAGRPLLNMAILHERDISGLQGYLDPPTARKQPPLPDVTIVKLLFDHGADPNQQYDHSTPWINLFHQASRRRPYSPEYGLELKKRWLDSIELFLQHGADPAASKDISTGRALRDAFRHSNQERVAELEVMLQQCLESKRRAQHESKFCGCFSRFSSA